LFSIGGWIVNFRQLPMPKGKIRYRKTFHELLMVTGNHPCIGSIFYTTSLIRSKRKFPVHHYGSGFLPDRSLPIGLSFEYIPQVFFNSGNACFGSFRSINTDPPWLRFVGNAGNPFSQFNFTYKFRMILTQKTRSCRWYRTYSDD